MLFIRSIAVPLRGVTPDTDPTTSASSAFYWNAAFERDRDKVALGKWLYWQLNCHFLKEGYGYADFMRGDEEYKLQWTEYCTWNWELIINRTVKARQLKLLKSVGARQPSSPPQTSSRLKPLLGENEVCEVQA